MNKDISVESPSSDGIAELARIGLFEEELARVPVNSPRHRELTAAISVEADAYRKSLDTQQALAAREARAEPDEDRATRSRRSHDTK